MRKVSLVIALLPMFAFAQDRLLTFEVASVKPSPPAPKKAPIYIRYGPQSVDAGYYPLRGLIVEAYQLQSTRILTSDSHGDDLLNGAYDVVAKAEYPVPKEQLRLMLRTLLANRFKLSVHIETKQQPVYMLEVGRQGAKLQKSDAEEPNPVVARQKGGFAVRNATVAQFCERLSGLIGRPVMDATRIQGIYSFNLMLEGMPTEEQRKNGADLSSTSIFTDIQEQLGLRLVPDKAPGEVLFIDHVEKPSEN
jgi:uncharacterized protein (TIGR03435 family)